MALKICHLISGDLWAGAESVAFQLLTGLQSRPEVELFVILLNSGTLRDKLEKANIAVTVIDEKKRTFLEIAWLAAKMLRTNRPHILHSHRYKEHFLGYLLSLSLGSATKLVATQHGMPEIYDGTAGFRYRLQNRLSYALLSKKFHKTVAVSSDIKQAFIDQANFNERSLETIPNGIVIPHARVFNDRKESFVIGSAGRFFPVKDYLFMVDVAKEVCAKSDAITFELAGEGPMLSRIRDSIAKYGLERRFLLKGFIVDIDEFYEGLDAYINTSIHEGIPMSVLEAMALGVPTIAPRVGGLAEIVTDGVDGFLIDRRDPALFAEKCLALCLDVKQRKNMAQAARTKVVERFSVDRMVTGYLELYFSVIGHVEAKAKDSGQPEHRSNSPVK